jgi:hypothetical protein
MIDGFVHRPPTQITSEIWELDIFLTNMNIFFVILFVDFTRSNFTFCCDYYIYYFSFITFPWLFLILKDWIDVLGSFGQVLFGLLHSNNQKLAIFKTDIAKLLKAGTEAAVYLSI